MEGTGRNLTFLRMETLKQADVSRVYRHNERKNRHYQNESILPSESHRNIHYKSSGEYSYLGYLQHLQSEGILSDLPLRKNAILFNELLFDINPAYFDDRGGYEFARKFYGDVYRFAVGLYGESFIVSAVMHADEIHRSTSAERGRDVFHYHMHVVAIPAVPVDHNLSGNGQARFRVCHSVKWPRMTERTEGGITKTVKTFSLLQDRFYSFLLEAGYQEIERGMPGSTMEHLPMQEYKLRQAEARLEELAGKIQNAEQHLQDLEAQKKAVLMSVREAEANLERAGKRLTDLEESVRCFCRDPESLLPQPERLESAKAYRENKAVPLIRAMQKTYLPLRSAWLDLQRVRAQLQKELAQSKADLDRLKKRAARAEARSRSLAIQEERYELLCRHFGRETLETLIANRTLQERTDQNRQDAEALSL